MSGKEMCFQVPPKTFRFDGRITQRIWQWVPNCQTWRGIFTSRRLAEWSSILPVGNFGDWHYRPAGIPYSSVSKTPMNSHDKLVLRPLQCG